MQIGSGKAFSVGQPRTEAFGNSPVIVAKTWTAIGGRQFLIEKLDYLDIADQLARLPKFAANLNSAKGAIYAARNAAKSRAALLASLSKPVGTEPKQAGGELVRMAKATT